MLKTGTHLINLKEKIVNLEKHCAEHDQLLKYYRINSNDLTPQMEKELDEYANFKRQSGLSDLDLTFIEEWQSIRNQQSIPTKFAISKISHNVQLLERELQKTQNEVAEANSFLSDVRRAIKSEDELNQLMDEKTREISFLNQKRSRMVKAKHMDIDEIMEKVQKALELQS